MRQSRDLIIAPVLLLLTVPVVSQPAQQFPSGTVRIVVPFPPGGSTDLVARIYATQLGDRWKQTVVVENRPGGDGMLAPTAVARSRPDGYTLLMGAPTLATVQLTMKDPPIDPAKQLDPVTQLVETPYVIAINAQLPAGDLKSFIAHARANAGKLNYGTWSTGGQLTYGFFKQLTGVDFVRVGYKGEAITMTALGSNEVQVAFGTSISLAPPLQAGTVRALAVSSAGRLPTLPDIPTTAEAGLKEFNESVWFGLFAPAGTPRVVKIAIADEIAKIAVLSDVISRLRVAGFEAKTSSPDEFSEFFLRTKNKWIEVAKALDLKPQ